eukprot:CAMPEP_0117575750 /NCGR_PEP_ID=MMETSP0784-20121206/62392_1 /TAXON_ID=39447 /ORGANISM="" /LENGTH=87 /DNA_ID=CAMNT_0005374879 /DNA_START=132 /DNA_END=395 /DNA_ORIENTATION=-
MNSNRVCAQLRRSSGAWKRSCITVMPRPVADEEGGQMLENDDGTFRIMPPLELPGGTWKTTAKDVTLRGRHLCASLRCIDLSWATQY